ncbi:MAG: stage III sporulation protein AC [Oscillospiraceae bacterium]|jgi:stage III sporulation protein AC|nr:stage III sporulation protein AC [Oscillospiraceae bacterium]
MEMEIIIKIAAVGLIVAVLHQILCKIGREEYAMLLVLAGIVVIIMMLLPQLAGLLDAVQGVFPT